MKFRSYASILLGASLCFLISFSVLPATAQKVTGSALFAKQLLKLEGELDQFNRKIIEKEDQIRSILRSKSTKLYSLRQKQRSSSQLEEGEKLALSDQISSLNDEIRGKKIRVSEVISMMEQKRKELLSLKLSIDDWMAKVEQTEIAVIGRIDRMKEEISKLIEKLDSEFPDETGTAQKRKKASTSKK